jgi:hypothetical protein
VDVVVSPPGAAFSPDAVLPLGDALSLGAAPSLLRGGTLSAVAVAASPLNAVHCVVSAYPALCRPAAKKYFLTWIPLHTIIYQTCSTTRI